MSRKRTSRIPMLMSHLAKLQRKVAKDPRLPTPADSNGRQHICTPQPNPTLFYPHILDCILTDCINNENYHIKDKMFLSLTSIPSCLYPAVAFSI